MARTTRAKAGTWRRGYYGLMWPGCVEEHYGQDGPAGGFSLEQDRSSTVHPIHGVGEMWVEPPPTEFPPELEKAPDPHAHRTFGALAGRDVDSYADHLHRFGHLKSWIVPGGEPLLFWRWHAERMAYLLKLLDAWKAMRRGYHPIAEDHLRSAAPLYPEPSSMVWDYPARAKRGRGYLTLQNFPDDPLVMWGGFPDPVRYEMMEHPPIAMSLDLERVYHPDHEHGEAGEFCRYAFEAGKYRIKGDDPTFRAFMGRESPADALQGIEPVAFESRLRAALLSAVEGVAAWQWEARIDPKSLAAEVVPEGQLGVVYEAFLREMRGGVLTRTIRECQNEACAKPLAGNAKRRYCGDACRMAHDRAEERTREKDARS